jgi:hypothetical protein
MKLLMIADEIANQFNSATSTTDRNKLKADWYAEVKKVEQSIQTRAAMAKNVADRRKKRAAGCKKSAYSTFLGSNKSLNSLDSLKKSRESRGEVED